jgi:outer membrane cobalamin receptor
MLVTASSVPRSVEETAKAIDVVTAREIADRDEASVVDVIRTLPGVRVKQLGGPGEFVTLRTRGLRDQDTAILIDGMRFRDSTGLAGDATAFLHDMAVLNLDRAEFLRGSGSSLYGSHALGGVLNLITRPGGGAPHGEFRSEGGGLGFVRDVLEVGGGFHGDLLTYTGGISYMNLTRGIREGQDYRNGTAQGSLRLNISPSISLTTRLWASKGDLALMSDPTYSPTMAGSFAPDAIAPAIALPREQVMLFETFQPYTEGNATFVPEQIDSDARIRSRFVNSATSFQQRVTSRTSYRIAYQGVATRRANLNGFAGGPGAFAPIVPRDGYEGYVGTTEFRVDHSAGKRHVLSFGFESEAESYRNFDGSDHAAAMAYSTHIQQHSKALYMQDQIVFEGGRGQVTLAGRVQSFGLEAPEFLGTTGPYAGAASIDTPNANTGDISASYFFQDSRTKVRGHIGNSFRAPSSFERFGGDGTTNFGDPGLKADRAVALDGGIDKWFVGPQAQLQLSATVFYTGLLETVGFGTLGPGDAFGRTAGYLNSDGGVSRGVEVGAQISGETTSARAGYTYTISDMRNPTIPVANYYMALSQPTHTVVGSLTQRFGRAKISFDMTAVTEYAMQLFEVGFVSSRGYLFDGYVKGDVVGSVELPRRDGRSMELYAKVDNVFNRKYFEDGFAMPGIWAIAGIRVRY